MLSRLILSGATVSAIIGLVLAVGAFVLDSWVVYQVDRREIINAFNRDSELNVKLKDAFTKDVIYFTRHQGLLWTCFPDSVPSESNSFMFAYQPCIYNKDYLPTDAAQMHFNKDQNWRLWLLRGVVAFYTFGAFLVLTSFVIGGFACFKRSHKSCGYTAITLIFGALFITAAIGLWLYVDYMDRVVMDVAPFYRSWETVLKNTTTAHYGVCFAGAWVGVGFLLMSAFCFYLAKRSIRKDDDAAMVGKQGGYMMPYYEKTATMMPYGYNTYGGSAYPYPFNPYTYGNAGGYYAYQTYGR